MRPVVGRLEGEFGAQVDFVAYNIDSETSAEAKRVYRFRAQPQVVIVDANGDIAFSRLSQLTYTQLKRDLQDVLVK